ncbi:hypothetical protein Asp14428_25890 [Actinoplanes sp. NBRC 14428]|nr:hypothetical protein Asp14428_25890 [Actinoplanes sp. NBRC 14428]
MSLVYTAELLQAGAQAAAAEAWTIGTAAEAIATIAPAHNARRRDFFTASPQNI